MAKTVRERLILGAIGLLALWPLFHLAALVASLTSGKTPASLSVLWDGFNLAVSLSALYLAGLETTRPVVVLTGLWKPSAMWLVGSLILIAYGISVVLRRGSSDGWVVATWGVVQLVRCVRESVWLA